jgi:hypothetical protein
MTRNTITTLIIDDGEISESFTDFRGSIPQVKEVITFYRKLHDGCQYKGIVTKVEHRIAFTKQNSKSDEVLQDIVVYIDPSITEPNHKPMCFKHPLITPNLDKYSICLICDYKCECTIRG